MTRQLLKAAERGDAAAVRRLVEAEKTNLNCKDKVLKQICNLCCIFCIPNVFNAFIVFRMCVLCCLLVVFAGR